MSESRLVGAAARPDDDDERTLRPKVLADFVGQAQALLEPYGARAALLAAAASFVANRRH